MEGRENLRKDIIYDELKRLSSEITKKKLLTGINIGFSAEFIGKNVGIARNTVSKELTSLCIDGYVIKVKIRPVLFIHKGSLEILLGCEIDNKFCEVKDIREILEYYSVIPNGLQIEGTDPFTKLIGYDKSLAEAIAKAKAAVLYPPNGLHIMLTGQSGVGKTYFAEIIHEFAQKMGVISKNGPLVYFNCSEYYNNPELLTSYLFGYEEGAFTGATKDKEGIIKKADGGFLFLDEVHRLPSEGQEKLFSILDKGSFRKLGSPEKEEKINLRLICATTEDIKSGFLKTFLRRIQVNIELLPLRDKSIEEKIELVFNFFQIESKKINLEIRISQEYMYYLLSSDFEANIGELKSEIQFACAQAYVNKISQRKDYLLIDGRYVKHKNILKDIGVRQILKDMFDDRKYISIFPHFNENLTEKLTSISEEDEPDIFYSYLSKEYKNLRNSNIQADETSSLLMNKLETIFHYGIAHNSKMNKNITKEYGYRIEDKIKKIIEYIEELVGFTLENNEIENLRTHLLTLISFINKGEIPMIYPKNLSDSSKLGYYDCSKKICKKIEAVFNIKCPNTELIYMNLLINELKNKKSKLELQTECGVILIAHGNSTATSMADFSNNLFGSDVITAIDMPIDQSVHDTLDFLVKKVEERGYKRLILLVDIGSLVYFGDIVSKMFQMKTLLIKNTTTLVLLEITRQVIYEPIDFDNIIKKMENMKIECELFDGKVNNKSKVLIISCITGLGTAVKIKELIEDILRDYIDSSMRICVVDYGETESLDRLSGHIDKNERTLGIIGTFKAELPDIPFISLDQLFSEEGIELLIAMLELGNTKDERKDIIEDVSKKFIQDMAVESIIDYITFLNPQRVLSEINDVYDKICKELNMKFSQQVTLRFMIHCCCMVERIVVSRRPLEIPESMIENVDERILSVIKVSFKNIESTYDINLSDGEVYYIYDLLFT